MQLVLFYLFGGASVVTAFITITSRKSVNAAVSTVGTMFCLAGLYVMLDAHLMAALMIIVYAGAIMVLTLFVIMLLNLSDKEGVTMGGKHKPVVQVLMIVAVGLLFIKVVSLFQAGSPVVSVPGTDDFGTIRAVGKLLFTRFLLQFELASILLLVAIVGAVILAKKQKRR